VGDVPLNENVALTKPLGPLDAAACYHELWWMLYLHSSDYNGISTY